MSLLWSFVFSAILALVSSQACDNAAVQNLQLEQVDTTIVASWSPNAGDCEYEVTFSSNADNQDTVTITTTETSASFSNAIPCSDVTAAVTAAGGSPASANLIVEMRGTTAPILRDMITSCNSIEMIWDAEPYESNMCQVTHFQMFCLSDTHNFTIPKMVDDVRDRSFDILVTVLQPDIFYTCNGFIFVTLAGFSPPSADIQFWSNLDSVRDLEVVETETSFSASWEAPVNSEECGVAYEVTYENEILGSTSVEIVGLSHDFDIELIPCTDYTITVKPISFTGSKGTAVSEEITPTIRVGQVSDLAISDEGDALGLSWNAATVGVCAVSYSVQYLVNDEVVGDEETTGTSLTFGRTTCASNTFLVRVMSEGITGNPYAVNVDLLDSDITSISEVRDILWENDNLSWKVPLSVGFCRIAYEITRDYEFASLAIWTIYTNATVELRPCSNNTITVRGVTEDMVGVTTTLEYIGPAQDLTPPTHVRTLPTLVSASVTLQAQTIYENMCEVEAAIVECGNDEDDSFQRTIEIEDNRDRIISIYLDDLQPDTVYTCVARLQNSPAGNEFSFRTRNLYAKELVISDVGQREFLTSWTEDYDKQFVSGYTLIVESTGPLHNVPDWCDIEREAVYTFDIPSDELSSLFTYGFPNYLYKVNLITSYTLGIEMSSNVVSDQTLTAEPAAPADLGAEWLYTNNEPFDVSAVVSWNAPCELNGGLIGFLVNTEANFTVAGVDQSVTVESVVDAYGTSINAAFSFTLADINPFFTYDVSVNVAADGVGPSSTIQLRPPSACVCPAE